MAGLYYQHRLLFCLICLALSAGNQSSYCRRIFADALECFHRFLFWLLRVVEILILCHAFFTFHRLRLADAGGNFREHHFLVAVGAAR